VGALPVGERAVPAGVLCTPFAAGALLLHPSVGALPVGEGLFAGRALHAVRSGGAAPTHRCGALPAGGRAVPGGAAPTDLCGSPALGANGAQRAPAQLCLKFGWRFSTNACMPSVWSAVAKIEWNTRRS